MEGEVTDWDLNPSEMDAKGGLPSPHRAGCATTNRLGFDDFGRRSTQFGAIRLLQYVLARPAGAAYH